MPNSKTPTRPPRTTASTVPPRPCSKRPRTARCLDPENDGQQDADQMDDSLRMDTEARTLSGPAPASAENLPRELTNPSDRAFTLPEEQQ
ncbi:MAG: hypothetical protein WKG07_24580 [Hymenobacter sp.]